MKKKPPTCLLKPFPEELFTLPGIAQDLADFAYLRATRDSRIAPTITALVAMSILSGHQYVVRRGRQLTALNLGIVLEMASGAGKENLRGSLDEILYAMGRRDLHFSPHASGEALHKDLADESRLPVGLVIMDEIGRFLVAAQRDSNKYTLITMLMQILANPLGSLGRKKYAAKNADLPIVEMPYVVLAAMTTAAELDPVLQVRDAANGFLNRLLLVRTDDLRPPEKLGDSSSALPRPVQVALGRMMGVMDGIDTAEACRKRAERSPQAYAAVRGRLFRVIAPSAEAEVVLADFGARAQVHYTDGRHDPISTLWGRTSELVVRVAGVLALASGVQDEKLMRATKPLVMGVEHVNWAVEFVVWCTENMLGIAETEISENANDRARKKILQGLAALVQVPATDQKATKNRWTEDNRSGWVAHAQITNWVTGRARDLTGQDVRAALHQLEETAEIVLFDAHEHHEGEPIPEGLSPALAARMKQRTSQARRIGAGNWYRLG